jgi:CDGSH-type Zn-finger protein
MKQGTTETTMAKTTITANLNGSLKVEGDVRLVDHEGREIPTKEGIPFFLCRCGGSANKPFCDGTHKRIGFQAE